MKRVICDACRAEVDPDAYGLAPMGWYAVSKRGDYGPTKDYCSSACVVASFLPKPVSAVERTIEDAERSTPPLHPVMLV